MKHMSNDIFRQAIRGLALAAALAVPSVALAQSADVLRIANPVAVTSLDGFGARSADQPTISVMQQVLEPLVIRKDGELQPLLAKSWDNPDELTWRFHLNEGITFADGSPLTSKDVKASLQRLIDGKGPLAGLWAAVETIDTPDDLTLDIKTSTRLGTVLSNLSMLGIAPAAALEDPNFFNAPFGTGPYRVTEFTPSQFVALERNPEYRNEPAPTARLEYRYIPEMSGRITALENNEIDVTWGVPPDQVAQLRDSQSLTVESFPTFGNYYMWYNSSREPFTDVRVRQAMWHAVNMEEIKTFLFEGTAEVAKGPIPQDVFGAAEQTPYAYDPDKARQLLAEAGYPNGFSTTMMWSSQCCTNIREFAETLISQWAAVGIQVTPQELERATWLENLLALNWYSTLSEGNTITGDADFTLARLYLSTAKRMGYANPELDALLLEARAEIDQGKRAELYAQAGKIIWDEAVGIFPLDMKMHAVYRKEVTGFVPTPTGMPRFDTVSKQ